MTTDTARAQLAPIVLTLPYPVSLNRYWRSIVIHGQSRTLVSKEGQQYKAEVQVLAAKAGIRRPITGRVAIGVQLYPQRPQDWARRAAKAPLTWDDDVRCIDLDNANKVLLDALKGVVIEDDKWVRRIDAERMEPDQHGARVVVTVRPIVVAAAQPDLLGEAA